MPPALWRWHHARDLLEHTVRSVTIRCRSCGRLAPVVRGGVCPRCGADAMAMLVRPMRRRRLRVDAAADRHIAEQVRDAARFREVMIQVGVAQGRRDVGVHHDDVIRAATLRPFRQGR